MADLSTKKVVIQIMMRLSGKCVNDFHILYLPNALPEPMIKNIHSNLDV